MIRGEYDNSAQAELLRPCGCTNNDKPPSLADAAQFVLRAPSLGIVEVAEMFELEVERAGGMRSLDR